MSLRLRIRWALVKPLERFLRRVTTPVMRVASMNGSFASLYYLLVSSSFRREQQATLAGKAAYYQSRGRLGASSTVLRRNIHRLEKGLVMKPRRCPFALEYIGETVDHFIMACQEGTVDAQELAWAGQVLKEYFACHAHEPAIHPYRLLSHALTDANGADPDGERLPHLIPYSQGALPRCPVAYDDFLTLARKRRSVRWFQPRPVSRDQIEKAVLAATLAPSACNRQPFWFELLSDPHDAQRIAQLAMGTQGFAENIPCLLVMVGDLQAFPHERDRHLIYIDTSLAAMSLMLALETLGLSSCPINWPDIPSRERKMQQALGFKVHQRPIMLIALGYADPEGGIPYSQKKPLSLLLRFRSLQR
jgi:nitroreductase